MHKKYYASKPIVPKMSIKHMKTRAKEHMIRDRLVEEKHGHNP
jgi:hypothetical protein